MTKKKSLLILLLLMSFVIWAETPQSTSEPPTLTPQELALSQKYKIDPQKLYLGSLTVKALLIQLTEAEAQAKTDSQSSWDLGYKAAAENLSPGKKAAEQMAINLQVEIQAEKAKNQLLTGVSIASATAALVCLVYEVALRPHQ